MSDHHDLVVSQFDPQAAAYVTSAVHAQGEDLDDLAARMKGRPHARVLDLGSGGGHVTFTVAPLVASAVAYDLSTGMLDAVRNVAAERGLTNVETVAGAAEQLPFADASFDVVLTRFSAHHWHDLAQGLREARRVLKPAGEAIFMDGIAPEAAPLDTFLQAIELLRDPSHVRDYTLTEWTRHLEAAGFRVTRTTSRRLRLEFAAWIARMRTPAVQVEAIRALEALASSEVASHFDLESDGSFTFDVAAIDAVPA
jgi:ubiquinone/menaquinone biosynthesis C-methylase UbiE